MVGVSGQGGVTGGGWASGVGGVARGGGRVVVAG